MNVSRIIQVGQQLHSTVERLEQNTAGTVALLDRLHQQMSQYADELATLLPPESFDDVDLIQLLTVQSYEPAPINNADQWQHKAAQWLDLFACVLDYSPWMRLFGLAPLTDILARNGLKLLLCYGSHQAVFNAIKDYQMANNGIDENMTNIAAGYQGLFTHTEDNK
jgi:hypothetical protein